jgi:hypothetical protein
MNEDAIANLLSFIIPYLIIVLWVLIPIALVWGIILLVKKRKKNTNRK